MTQPSRAQRMRAIEHERGVVSLSIGKLRKTFSQDGLLVWKNDSIMIAVDHLETALRGLDKLKADLIQSCETDGHELAPGEAGYTEICMVCDKKFESEEE